ncbi:MAG TPA: CoA-binding protein [Acidimicrobiales bacterium]|nr:CoA-binding protein [Acidimicrobiales bacterium]
MTTASPGFADLGPLLAPESIAIIGASSDPARLGGRPLQILLQHGYGGSIYPINPGHDTVGGLPAYPSISAAPGPVDVAAVIVPASLVVETLRECAAAGVRSAVVFSSGFAEQGEEGRFAEQQIAEIARSSGMRVVGPNAEGFFNLTDRIPLTFSPTVDYERGLSSLVAGNVAVVSQSGGLGFALFNGGQAVGLGASFVVSTGNEADLGALEVAAYLLQDPATDVIALLVEGLRPGEEFGPVATRARGLGKTIVVAKLGRSTVGAEAAAAHTGHDAGEDEQYQKAFSQPGVVQVFDQEDLLDACLALSRPHRPAGRNVGVVTTSGGAGVWLADACAAAGLDVPKLDAALQAELRRLMPSYGSPRNPVDVTAEIVNRAGVVKPLELVLSSPQIDMVVWIASLAGPLMLEREESDIRRVVASTTKPVLIYSYTTPGPASVAALARLGLAWYPSPARAARAAAALVEAGRHP